MTEPAGYLSPLYAQSLAEFGEPIELPRSGGWILRRAIRGSQYFDAMGIYPRLFCTDWNHLADDINSLSDDLVSLAFVTEPFADVSFETLEETCHVAFEYKKHFIVDFDGAWENAVSKHHRYYARKSLREMTVELVASPIDNLNEWLSLYQNLIKRHSIKGIQAFSRDSFRQQLHIPGFLMIIGRLNSTGHIAGMHLVFQQGSVAYSHLAAISEEGYRKRASYGIYAETLRILASRSIRFLDLGAAAGLKDNPTDGLSQFKQGWSNAEKSVMFCGKILDDKAYSSLCQEAYTENTLYFPAYRYT